MRHAGGWKTRITQDLRPLPSPRKLEDTTQVTGCSPGKISDVVIVGSGAFCSKHNQAKMEVTPSSTYLTRTFRRFENSRNMEVTLNS
jgi:hypothetical protein